MPGSEIVSDPCLIMGRGECRQSHRCYDCWLRSCEKPKDQIYVDDIDKGKWSQPLQPFVEDGISMLACLLAEKETIQSSFDVRPRTANWAPWSNKTEKKPVPPAEFDNGTFGLRTYLQAPYGDWMFKVGDIEVTWYMHINNNGFQNRRVKGMEWLRILNACALSLGAK